jgi:hypothetical protein
MNNRPLTDITTKMKTMEDLWHGNDYRCSNWFGSRYGRSLVFIKNNFQSKVTKSESRN